MTKRSLAAILTTDDGMSQSHNSKLSKPLSKFHGGSSLAKSKKARLSHSKTQPTKEFSAIATNEFKLLSEDFEEKFTQCKVSTGSRQSCGSGLWCEKYKPHSMEELAVNKKKIEEVKIWLEKKFKTTEVGFEGNALLLTGPAGVGKSATIHVIASDLGAKLLEWNTPTPTLWQEHVHNSNAGTSYMSKLDEFEMFIERARKFGLFQDSLGGKRTAVILLIDDLPMANGKCASERLKNCLQLFVRTTPVATAILISDYSKVDVRSTSCGFFEQLQSSLEMAGAHKISFNPITANSVKKILSWICKQEQCGVTAEQVDLIAKSCGGDIRHAITSLQYFSLKPYPLLSSHLSNNGCNRLEVQKTAHNPVETSFVLSCERDDTFSLFHTLGKFLHNKRDTGGTAPITDGSAFALNEKLKRFPMKMGSPEKVLAQTHAPSKHILDFLHENVLDFLSDEAAEDASVCLSYLSDADLLLATLGRVPRSFEAEGFFQNAAASLAGRGLLFGNSHPSPSRWHALRRPNLWQVERSSWHTKKEMKQGGASTCCGRLDDAMAVVTEFIPVSKWLGFRVVGYSPLLQAEETDFSEDEIEDP